MFRKQSFEIRRKIKSDFFDRSSTLNNPFIHASLRKRLENKSKRVQFPATEMPLQLLMYELRHEC